MHYYHRLAPAWHRAAGADGGPLKALLLNERTLGVIPGLEGLSILEVGAGNGYLMKLLVDRYPGRRCERLVISDQARPLVDLARRHFPVEGAEYRVVDLCHALPFGDASFDYIVADLVLHELHTAALRRSLLELRRVLRPGGALLGSVYHPRYVEALDRAGQLGTAPGGLTVLPAFSGLYTPVVRRRERAYHAAFRQWARLETRFDKVHAPPELFEALPDLQRPDRLPIALSFRASPSRL